MSDKKKGSVSIPTVGGSSLLVIFAVLCLTVFALLSMSTVKGDTALSQRSADSVVSYYKADTLAEELVARIRNGKLPDGVRRDGQKYSFTCKINDTSALCVELTADGNEYEITRWQAVSTLDWQPDTDIIVWDGEIEN